MTSGEHRAVGSGGLSPRSRSNPPMVLPAADPGKAAAT